MKTKLKLIAICHLLSAVCLSAFAQGPAFTYQGQLQNNGSPANGTYDLKLHLYNASTNGGVIAGPITNSATAVSNGLFTVILDFGNVYDGTILWLQIGVRTNGAANFTALTPRQQLTPAPYAIFAEGANAAGLTGTLPGTDLGGTYGNPVNFNNASNSISGTFSGSGVGLTNVWQTSGNARTSAGANFVGTTDNQPLEMHVHGQRALRLEPDTTGSGAPNVIGGSPYNYMDAGSVIGGFIGGGGATSYNGVAYPNHVAAYFGSVVGGYANTVSANANNAFIGGGDENTNAGPASVIGGGEVNYLEAAADHSVIGGGGNNTIVGSALSYVYSAIGGGQNNLIRTNTSYAIIGGGYQNIIGNNNGESVIGGGFFNTIRSGPGGAAANTIVGGVYNEISVNTYNAAIGGGGFNTNGGPYATIPGGYGNSALGYWSFAAGDQAQAFHQGAFVWADAQGSPFASTGNNQFLIRASGGVGINLNNPGTDSLNVGGTVRVNNNDLYFRASPDTNHGVGYYGSSKLWGGVFAPDGPILYGYGGGGLGTMQDGLVNIGLAWNNLKQVTIGGWIPIGSAMLTVGNATCDGSNWQNASDRNLKEHLLPVDPEQVLAKVIALPVLTWNYKSHPAENHLGPVAQDFHTAFGLNGTDDKRISTVDEGGVALAAIQGLNQKLEEQAHEKDARISTLEKKLAELEKLIIKLSSKEK